MRLKIRYKKLNDVWEAIKIYLIGETTTFILLIERIIGYKYNERSIML